MLNDFCYKLVLICVMLFTIVLNIGAAADYQQVIKGPKNPDVVFNDPTKYEADVKAEIVIAGNRSFRAIIKIDFNSIAINYKENKKNKSLQLPVEQIVSIEITRWRPVRYQRNKYRFMPYHYIVKTKDGKEHSVITNIPQFNVLRFVNKEQLVKKMFTYFYDYWKIDFWENAQKHVFDFPQTNPLAGTVVKIIFFNNRRAGFDLRKLLK